MIIKMIAGKSGEGKRIELLKELNSTTCYNSIRLSKKLILFDEQTDMLEANKIVHEIINKLNGKNHNIDSGQIYYYQLVSYKNLLENLKDTEMILVDSYTMTQQCRKRLIKHCEEAGVKKFCYTVQLNHKGELRL